jgi:hypothetical protein
MQHTLCLTHVSSDVLMLRTSYSWSEVRNMDRLEDPPVPPELCRIDEVDRSVRTWKSPDGLCCCASLRVACHKFGRIGQTRAHANAKNGSIVLFAVLKTTQRTHTHKHINTSLLTCYFHQAVEREGSQSAHALFGGRGCLPPGGVVVDDVECPGLQSLITSLVERALGR